MVSKGSDGGLSVATTFKIPIKLVGNSEAVVKLSLLASIAA